MAFHSFKYINLFAIIEPVIFFLYYGIIINENSLALIRITLCKDVEKSVIIYIDAKTLLCIAMSRIAACNEQKRNDI
jgi:hypothetical protein